MFVIFSSRTPVCTCVFVGLTPRLRSCSLSRFMMSPMLCFPAPPPLLPIHSKHSHTFTYTVHQETTLSRDRSEITLRNYSFKSVRVRKYNRQNVIWRVKCHLCWCDGVGEAACCILSSRGWLVPGSMPVWARVRGGHSPGPAGTAVGWPRRAVPRGGREKQYLRLDRRRTTPESAAQSTNTDLWPSAALAGGNHIRQTSGTEMVGMKSGRGDRLI